MFKKVLFFYIDGFKSLSSVGQKLWLIIIIKLVVIFVVLKVFFFPNISSKIKGEENQKALYLKHLTEITTNKKNKEE